MTRGVFALVPVKDPAQGKSRLADVLDARARADLNLTLAHRTFECCAAAFGPERTVVVTAAEAIATEASDRRLVVVREGSPGGLNAALALAARRAIGQGAGALLVVPVDLVLLTPEALRGVASIAMGVPGRVLVPDRHGVGTNLLGVRPARADLFRFGERSLDEHRRAATEAGLEVRVHADPTLALDLDTPEDLPPLGEPSVNRPLKKGLPDPAQLEWLNTTLCLPPRPASNCGLDLARNQQQLMALRQGHPEPPSC